MKKLLLLLSLTVLVRAAAPAYAPFRADLPAGAAYRIDAHQLHPTQLVLGWREVVAKRKLIEAKTPAMLVAYLQDKDVPVVIGPGGVPYLTDGHHTLRALIESKVADKTAYGHILANWSDIPPGEFWQRMQARNYTYLKDGEGRGPFPATRLPGSLRDLELDPYRGLAWGVMKAGGFDEQKGVYFQEFLWADEFRTRITWDDRDDAAFDRAVQAACALAHAPAFAKLPGYQPAVAPLSTADK